MTPHTNAKHVNSSSIVCNPVSCPRNAANTLVDNPSAPRATPLAPLIVSLREYLCPALGMLCLWTNARCYGATARPLMALHEACQSLPGQPEGRFCREESRRCVDSLPPRRRMCRTLCAET